MPPTRRVRCVSCGLAKLEDEFSKSTVATAAKGTWSCLSCGHSVEDIESRLVQDVLGPTMTNIALDVLHEPPKGFVPPVIFPGGVDAPPLRVAPTQVTRVPEPPGRVAVGPVVLDYLNFVEDYVEKNTPTTCWPGQGLNLDPVTIPEIDRLRGYALKLDSVAKPGSSRQMFDPLLGRAAQVDLEYPIPMYLAPMISVMPGRPVVTELTFPRDHHFHPTWGAEWYYVCAKVPIVDSKGNKGEAAFLSSLQRTRAVGLTTQQKHGWTDAQSNILSNVCSMTIRFKDPWTGKVTRTVYARSALNTNWDATEPGSSYFSVPGEQFSLRMGTGDNIASLTSTQPATSPEILPAAYSVNNTYNGKVNIKTDLTFSTGPKVNKQQGWFLQGMPTNNTSPLGAPGDGMTLPPSPGIYYSWPQTVVTGTSMVVNGETFKITGPGNGWIDHQTMGGTLFNFDLSQIKTTPFPVQPIPFRQDPAPVNGWTWEFCNFDDGTSWTGAAFEEASPYLAALTIAPYGYAVKLGTDGKYVGGYTIGATSQTPATWVTAPAGRSITTPPTPPTPFVSQFQVPTDRDFLEQGSSTLVTRATGWTDPNGNKLPCDFNNANYTTVSEAPADWQQLKFFNRRGWGYLETVTFEPTYACQIRMMHYLDNSTYPDEVLAEDVRAK